MMTTTTISVDQIQRTNWEGAIPVVVTLAPTSLSSPTVPPSMHVLVSRQTYLHLGLLSVIRRLHPFAPVSLFGGGMVRRQKEPEPGTHDSDTDDSDDDNNNNNESKHLTNKDTAAAKQEEDYTIPVCWFEDEETQLPLRWQLFAGVLYDLMSSTRSSSSTISKSSSSSSSLLLPWKLRLHFTNYPTSIVLPLETGQVEQQIRAIFANSLKQAVTLRTGQSAVQLLTKEAHETLWQAISSRTTTTIISTSASLYRHVANSLAPKLSLLVKPQARIPVRLLLRPHDPVLQKSCPTNDPDLTLRQLLRQWLPLGELPAQLLVKPEQHEQKAANHEDDGGARMVVKVNGIQPSLETRIWDLWEHLCHVDYFLYIVVVLTN